MKKKLISSLLLCIIYMPMTMTIQPTPTTHDLVNVASINPRIKLDIRYATKNNFTKKKIYKSAQCYARRAVAEKLDLIQKELEKKGYGLLIWDAYRPLSAQRILWNIVPDERYVMPPEKGSRHNRGNAIDCTLVDKNGQELAMPTGFDDFSEKAHTNYMDLSPEVIANRTMLAKIMTKHGFMPMKYEWWHFDFKGWEKDPILDIAIEVLDIAIKDPSL
jgi:zinc D-Ala-D-Ala dipeptidase